MALSKQDLDQIVQLVVGILNERAAPVGIEGRVVAGSYHPQDGTIEVTIGDTDAAGALATALGDGDLTTLIAHPRVPLATNDPNDQYGPQGGEPVVLIPSQSSWVAKLYADSAANDAPGPGPYFSVKAPSGERWLFHRNTAGVIDSGIKLTNDGSTIGDGLGGTLLGHLGAYTQVRTAAQNQVALDDTAQTITVESASTKLQTIYNDSTQQIQTVAASGLYQLFDGANNLISIVAPGGGGVAVGKLWSALDSTHAAARNVDLTTLATNIRTTIGDALQQAAKAAVLASVPSAAAWLAQIQSGLPSFSFTDITSSVASLTVPDCSALVRIAD